MSRRTSLKPPICDQPPVVVSNDSAPVGRSSVSDVAPLKVTIITVAFNSHETIADTLRSVAVQSWPHIEHIVIDGGSTDDTLAIVAADGAHVARCVSGPDDGIFDAMNKGLALATGDVIAFLNSDDHYVDAAVVEDVVRALESSGVEAVLADVEFYDADPRRVVRRYRSSRFRPALLGWGWIPAHPGLFVRRRLFEKVGPFNAGYRIAGDYEWMVRAFRNPAMSYTFLSRPLVKMKMGGASTGGLRSKILLNREVVRACRENGVSTNIFKILSKYPLKMLELVQR